MNYYNEFDPYAAQWLRNLIANKIIPQGVVDDRSIVDVQASDLNGFSQCHFFAGIAGWSLALQLAGWPNDRQIWTGSCPCQPFSNAGEGKGFDDERHLWPAWKKLIQQCRPATVVGEQVASKLAESWIDAVFDDMEGLDYACAAAVIPAAGIGAPHIRDRMYWLAHSTAYGWGEGMQQVSRELPERVGGDHFVGIGMGNANNSGLQEHRGLDQLHLQMPNGSHSLGQHQYPGVHGTEFATSHHGGWENCDWIACRDGFYRPIEPGSQPLAHGIPGRVGRLCAYGNAIVPQQAASFLTSAMQSLGVLA